LQTIVPTIQAASEIPSIWDRQIEAAKRFFGIKPRPVVPVKPSQTPKQAAEAFLARFPNERILVTKPAVFCAGVAEANETLKGTIARTEVAALSKPTSGPVPVRLQILEVVRYSVVALSAREIFERIPGSTYSTVTTRISEMVRSGELSYTGNILSYGKYVKAYLIGNGI